MVKGIWLQTHARVYMESVYQKDPKIASKRPKRVPNWDPNIIHFRIKVAAGKWDSQRHLAPSTCSSVRILRTFKPLFTETS